METQKKNSGARVVYVRRIDGFNENSDLDIGGDFYRAVDYMADVLFEPARKGRNIILEVLRLIFP